MDEILKKRRNSTIKFAGLIAFGVVILMPLAVGGYRPHWWLASSAILLGLASIVALSFLISGRLVAAQMRLAPAAFWTYAAFLLGLAVHVFIFGGTTSDLDAVYGFMRQAGYTSLVWLLFLTIQRAETAQNHANFLLIGLVVYAGYGLFTITNTTFLLYEKNAYLGYATGPFVNRNSFATFMAMASSLALANALADPRLLRRKYRQSRRATTLEVLTGSTLALAVAVFCLATVFATGSRMGLMSAFIGLGVVLGLRTLRDAKAGQGRRAAWLLAALGFTSIWAIVALLYGGPVAERLAGSADSASVRLMLYENTWSMILQNPVLGVGFDNFAQSFRSYQDLSVSPDVAWDLAHNTYLALWAELGLVLGSLPPLALAFAAIALFRRSMATEQDAATHLSDAALAAIVLCAAHSLLDFSLEMPANTYLLITLIALGLGPTSQPVARS